MTNPQTIGKYEIIKELGRGGFGIVYQARDTRLGRVVALKLLHTHLNLDPAFASRFEREARAITALDHPSIVRIYDVEEINGQLAIVMAYLPGQTLRELIQTKGRFSPDQAAPILIQLADALDYIHTQGLVHRDMKPGNIMIAEGKKGQQAILFDLGLAKGLADYSSLTTTGTLLGSPEYMAPEQADPNRADEVGPAADRYAFGIIAYEMLTGRVPFPGNTPSTLYAHEHKTPPPPRQLQPDLPRTVERALLKMLAKRSADRFQQAGEFAIVLGQGWQEKQSSSLYPPFRDQSQTAKGVNVSPVWMLRVGSIVLLLACVVGLGVYSQDYWFNSDPTLPLEETPIPPTLAPNDTPILPTSTGASTALALALGATRTREADGMTMVYVPAGTFPMGSDDNNPEAQNDEKPQHSVTLDAFWIDQTEVTNIQYEYCVEAGGCAAARYTGEPDYNKTDHPVIGVSWQNAVDYCIWAGGRLPTEAEWEYAARGPEGHIYPWGDEFDRSKLNSAGTGDSYPQLAPVSSFSEGVSWVGAFNMVGNVWEWVNDWYAANYYANSLTKNPSGPENGVVRVLRGGSWHDLGVLLPAINRNKIDPAIRFDNIGFRCAMSIGDVPRSTQTSIASESSVTDTSVPPTLTSTDIPLPSTLTATNTAVPPTSIDTPLPPTSTATNTSTPTLAPRTTRIREADGMTMVYVPTGTFPMGSDDNDSLADDDEKPQHSVTLDAFWIDQTEVTNAQYERCVAAGVCAASSFASDSSFNGADYPVVGVSWQAAADYCVWAGGRLPTEAEWEYTARGPEGSIYPWGNVFGGTKLNSSGTDVYYKTAPVGSFSEGATWVGALDMSGNVWEWVNDWYDEDYYANSHAKNPLGSNNGEKRVLRGSSWRDNTGEGLRAASRNSSDPGLRYDSVGFRCVMPTSS